MTTSGTQPRTSFDGYAGARVDFGDRDATVATVGVARYALDMGTPARRDDLLEQIRALPIEDREYIEAALMREAYEQGRRGESDDQLGEIADRAESALTSDKQGLTREDSVARARAAVDTIRSRKS